jgi:flotillin
MPEVADRITRHLAEIDKVTILDFGGGGNGNGSGAINNLVGSATAAVKQTFEVVKETTGIDLEGATQRVVGNLGFGEQEAPAKPARARRIAPAVEQAQPDETE